MDLERRKLRVPSCRDGKVGTRASMVIIPDLPRWLIIELTKHGGMASAALEVKDTLLLSYFRHWNKQRQSQRGGRGAQAPYPRNSIGGKMVEGGGESEKEEEEGGGAPLVLGLAPPLDGSFPNARQRLHRNSKFLHFLYHGGDERHKHQDPCILAEVA